MTAFIHAEKAEARVMYMQHYDVVIDKGRIGLSAVFAIATSMENTHDKHPITVLDFLDNNRKISIVAKSHLGSEYLDQRSVMTRMAFWFVMHPG